MNEIDFIKEQLVVACKRAYRRGIQTGSGGNVSARLPGTEYMVVKASGSSFEDATPEGFIVTDFEGRVIEGKGKPTREALLHGFLYTVVPDCNAVVHVHSPYVIGYASTKKALPLTTWHAKLKMPADIPTLDIQAGVVPREDFGLVKELFLQTPNLPGFLLVDHGQVALGADPIQAEHTAELIEETAQVVYLKSIAAKLAL